MSECCVRLQKMLEAAVSFSSQVFAFICWCGVTFLPPFFRSKITAITSFLFSFSPSSSSFTIHHFTN